MPRPPIDSVWKRFVRIQIEKALSEGVRLTDAQLEKLCIAEAKRLGRNDPPSARSCGRIRKQHTEAPESERREYRLARWPESFGGADLPWEAAAAVIELTRFLGRPPLLPLARWYWRVTLAMPDAKLDERYAAAVRLVDAEANGLPLRDVGDAVTWGQLSSALVRTVVSERGDAAALSDFFERAHGALSEKERADWAAELARQWSDLDRLKKED